MIPKSGYRFCEKPAPDPDPGIMLKQHAKAKYRFNLKSFRFRRGENSKNGAKEIIG
jgi:hypothetical protein